MFNFGHVIASWVFHVIEWPVLSENVNRNFQCYFLILLMILLCDFDNNNSNANDITS